MITGSDLGGMLLNYSWFAVLGLVAIFFLIVLIVVIYLWYSGKLPVKRYDIKLNVYGKVGENYLFRTWKQGRVNVDGKGRRSLALRKGLGLFGMGFWEVKGIPFPTDNMINPDGSVDLLQRTPTDFQPMRMKDAGNNVEVELDRWERNKQAFISMEQERQGRNPDKDMLFQLLPYGVIGITIVGAFLIIAVISTPLVQISQQNVVAAKEYREASEANLRIVQLLNAGNNTVPFPNTEDKPPA